MGTSEGAGQVWREVRTTVTREDCVICSQRKDSFIHWHQLVLRAETKVCIATLYHDKVLGIQRRCSYLPPVAHKATEDSRGEDGGLIQNVPKGLPVTIVYWQVLHVDGNLRLDWLHKETQEGTGARLLLSQSLHIGSKNTRDRVQGFSNLFSLLCLLTSLNSWL